jgi:hypothetical protein
MERTNHAVQEPAVDRLLRLHVPEAGNPAHLRRTL